MGGRYWITGVQLGMLRAFTSTEKIEKIEDILVDIEAEQYIGNVVNNEEVEIVIIKKKKGE